MFKYVLIAWRNLLAHRARSLMLGGAVAFTAFVLALLLGLTAGIERTLEDTATTLYSGHLNVNGFFKLSAGSAAPFIHKRARVLADVREIMPQARAVVDRFMGFGNVVAEKASIMTPMWGVDMNEEPDLLRALKTADEKEFGTSDVRALAKPGTMALYVKQARKLQVKVGDMLTLSMPTSRNQVNTKDVRVVAVLKDIGIMSSFSLLLNKADVQEIYNTGPDSTGQILIYLPGGADLAAAESRLRQGLEKKGYRLREPDHLAVFMKFDAVAAEPFLGQKLDITTWKDEVSYMQWILVLLNGLFFGITFILLFIIAMGVMNAVWISVSERTRENGTLRAIGMGASRVVLMFVLEGFLLAVISCLAGMILGVGAGALLNAARIPMPSEAAQNILLSDNLFFAVKAGSLAVEFLVITLVTTAGSLVPAWLAGRMKPITAIQAAV